MIITAPESNYNFKNNSVFLAGTIDNGNSVDWQSKLANELQMLFPRLDIYNPRRANWNPEADTTELRIQINWELEYLRKANIVFFNFLKDSKSPITMLELGITLANFKDCVIVNPPEFYRYENVRTTALNFERLTKPSYEQGVTKLIDKLHMMYS